MSKRKSSGHVSLVLIGLATAAVAGCSQEPESRRDVYASREDCLADWGNQPADGTPATDRRHAGGSFFYGPMYTASGLSSMGRGVDWSGSGARPGSHAIDSAGRSGGVARGGFGSTGRSSVS